MCFCVSLSEVSFSCADRFYTLLWIVGIFLRVCKVLLGMRLTQRPTTPIDLTECHTNHDLCRGFDKMSHTVHPSVSLEAIVAREHSGEPVSDGVVFMAWILL